jgi:hypothetical protein
MRGVATVEKKAADKGYRVLHSGRPRCFLALYSISPSDREWRYHADERQRWSSAAAGLYARRMNMP